MGAKVRDCEGNGICGGGGCGGRGRGGEKAREKREGEANFFLVF